ncbi:MAG: class I SAM-dependent methyltransferase [Chlorobi bacterium]|nr:class I SAM-dependent methyltransferase [Chlorobiota bacterium]
MGKLWQVTAYLNYLRKTKTRYNIHSPFVYDLIENVFKDKTRYKEFRELNRLRKKYARRTDKVETMDFGAAAGNKDYIVRVKTVGDVVKKTGHTKKQLEMLFRLTRYFKPENILEFGTSVGISASYLSKGYPPAKMITMEGSMGLTTIANETFENHNLNIEVEIGEFGAILDNIINNVDKLDMVFFDGNHRKKSTLRYFNKCMKRAHEGSVFMFDDIHWSRGMNKAWKKIKKDKRVSITVDLYWIGLVFFRKGIAKQDFILRY